VVAHELGGPVGHRRILEVHLEVALQVLVIIGALLVDLLLIGSLVLMVTFCRKTLQARREEIEQENTVAIEGVADIYAAAAERSRHGR
jgi:hypothetical protein